MSPQPGIGEIMAAGVCLRWSKGRIGVLNDRYPKPHQDTALTDVLPPDGVLSHYV